jgi:hypothetical protein
MTKLFKFYFRLLHPKAIAEKANEHFISFLTSPLIFEMPIPGGSAKRLWYLFFGAYCMAFFFPKNIVCSTLLILFTEILLKSRVCLHFTPYHLKYMGVRVE